MAQEGGESGFVCVRHQIAVHGREPRRGVTQSIEEGFQAQLFRLPLILTPETQQKGATLAVGEVLQIGLATRVLVVFEQFGAVVRALVSGVTHHVAHQTDKWQVERLTQGLAHAGDACVIFTAEICEGVDTAASEKPFVGAGGVFTFQRGIEHGGQAGIGGT